jgi:hypothetical protein
MNDLSWAATVRLVHERARYCCEYCQTCQSTIGQAMHVEHINPLGGNHPDNLCLACPSCNLSKSQATSAVDPISGQDVPLFNPRKQLWSEHFVWSESGLEVQGLTPAGRATAERLKMNQDRLIVARILWVKAKVHPPSFSGQ